MIALVHETAVGAVSAAPKAPVAAANVRAAQLPRKVKLAPQFNGIAPYNVSRRMKPFCHAEHGRRPSLALPIRRICHANRSAERRFDTETSVPTGLVTDKAVALESHDNVATEVADRPDLPRRVRVSQ